MELGHLLTRSGLVYPEVSSKVCHDSFCQLGNSVSLPWVIYYGAFYLHVVSSFSCIPVTCLKLVLFLIPLQFVHLFVIIPNVSCCSSHVFHLCCCYSSGIPCFNNKNNNNNNNFIWITASCTISISPLFITSTLIIFTRKFKDSFISRFFILRAKG